MFALKELKRFPQEMEFTTHVKILYNLQIITNNYYYITLPKTPV